MEVFTLSQNVQNIPQDAVLAVGNFDSVHKGHAYLIAQAAVIAHKKNRPLAVLTFEPHPRRLFRPEDPPFCITPLKIKLERLEQQNVNFVYVLPFNWETASLSAEDFVKNIIGSINPDTIVIGEDFHFGHNRTGDRTTLQKHGYECHPVSLERDAQHGTISATRIRGLIQSGHIDDANNLLGWQWIIEGKVQKGDQRGRELGFPTANVPLGETIHPAYGVYATWVRIEGESDWRMAATNIGIRPMFEVNTALVEAHILDFSGDIYGKNLEIMPVKKIRNEEKYESLNALIEQIQKDCATARDILLLKPAA